MAGKVHTDSEALYAIRNAITKFADDIQVSQSDLVYCFERMNYQIEDHVRALHAKREKLRDEKNQVDSKKEEVKDGRTDSFCCDLCSARMMLKIYSDSTHCRAEGCNGTMHRVFNNSEYQKYSMMSEQLKDSLKNIENEEEVVKALYNSLQDKQRAVVALLTFDSTSDPETTVNFIDKSIANIGDYQAVNFDVESETVKKK